MIFTPTQLTSLFGRLRQTKEELLYDLQSQQVERYSLNQRGGMILGVAHCDFVEDAWSFPTYFCNESKIRAGQVDDRVGVWLLLDVLPEIPGMPAFDYLLTTDEECGRSSAQEVVEPMVYNWTFQFDRRGTDFVDYGKASDKFIDAFKATTGIPHGIGSFSDICYLPSSCGSRVNIGTGYHDEHCPDAWVDLEECSAQVSRFVEFAGEYSEKRFAMRREPKKRYSAEYWSLNYGIKKDETDNYKNGVDNFDNWK